MPVKTFPGNLDSLSEIRDYLTEVSEALGIDKKVNFNLLLAVDEIATNIINYGYLENEIDGHLDFVVDSNEQELKVMIEDDAPKFDPDDRKMPDEEDLNEELEDRPIGGLGVYLAKSSVDEFKYEYEQGRNRNIFIVKR